MSLQSLTSGYTVNLQRPTTSKDAAGGPVRESFANVSGQTDLACDIQPVTSETVLRYAQRQLTVTNEVYFTQDVGAKAGYRLLGSDGKKYVIQGYENEAGRNRVWVAIVQEVLK